MTGSWDGRYKPSQNRITKIVTDKTAIRPVNPQLLNLSDSAAVCGEGTRQDTPQPAPFAQAEKISTIVASCVQKMPEFDAQVREQARKSAALAPVPENSHPLARHDSTDQQLSAQLEELLAKKYQEFSGSLERRLEVFYEQTASRLDVLSESIIHQFCETLNQQMTEALNTLMADRAEHNRALVEAECHAALDRFAARLDKVSLLHLEGHRKQIQLLSGNLKTRLRGVAHALEELGPNYRA